MCISQLPAYTGGLYAIDGQGKNELNTSFQPRIHYVLNPTKTDIMQTNLSKCVFHRSQPCFGPIIVSASISRPAIFFLADEIFGEICLFEGLKLNQIFSPHESIKKFPAKLREKVCVGGLKGVGGLDLLVVQKNNKAKFSLMLNESFFKIFLCLHNNHCEYIQGLDKIM